MEDEATKEDIQASTSKKESQRTNSRNDLFIRDRDHDEGASNSERSESASNSARSGLEMADARPEPPKPLTLGKRGAKAPEKKKSGRRGGGRVEKRRRGPYRRTLRRTPMRKKQTTGHHPRGEERHTKPEERRLRDRSNSTVFTRLSSRSGSRSRACVHCGHRCCRRRYEYELFKCTCRSCRNKRKGKRKKKVTKKLKKEPELKLFTPGFTVLSKEIQIGSRSHMLSPLFINTNSTPEAEVTLPEQTYTEVTPEMIFDSLCVLNLWREEVQTAIILKYIMTNYPVNREEKELFVELTEKLRIAAIVGIVIQTNEDCWSLAGELDQRRLTANHVTLFWKVYADTLRSICRK